MKKRPLRDLFFSHKKDALRVIGIAMAGNLLNYVRIRRRFSTVGVAKFRSVACRYQTDGIDHPANHINGHHDRLRRSFRSDHSGTIPG